MDSVREAAEIMMLAYIDYKDNIGSNEAEEFWADFERKRENYRRIKAENEY